MSRKSREFARDNQCSRLFVLATFYTHKVYCDYLVAYPALINLRKQTMDQSSDIIDQLMNGGKLRNELHGIKQHTRENAHFSVFVKLFEVEALVRLSYLSKLYLTIHIWKAKYIFYEIYSVFCGSLITMRIPNFIIDS